MNLKITLNDTEKKYPLQERIPGETAHCRSYTWMAADGDHIDVGLLGTKAILNALSENGQAELAYTLASQEIYPSCGYWIRNGATSLL